MREISLDTETTGLYYTKGDRIIEIGAVEIINKTITGNTYHVYLNPEREVSADSQKITGLNWDMLKYYKGFKDEYKGFLDFIKDDRLVIHNASFDIGFLNNELSIVQAPQLQMSRVVDTLSMVRKKYPGSPATLDALCRKFSIDSSIRSKHGALIDAELLAQVYIIISVELVQKNLFIENIENNIKHEISRKASVINSKMINLSKDEIDRHNKFLSKIKNPIWNIYNVQEN